MTPKEWKSSMLDRIYVLDLEDGSFIPATEESLMLLVEEVFRIGGERMKKCLQADSHSDTREDVNPLGTIREVEHVADCLTEPEEACGQDVDLGTLVIDCSAAYGDSPGAWWAMVDARLAAGQSRRRVAAWLELRLAEVRRCA